MIPKHAASHLANQEIFWYGTDSEKVYQQNLIKNRSLLEQYRWVDRPIRYKFNQQGFRADEFDSADPGVVFIGCSHTVGVGLPFESTWPYLISRELKLQNYNLAVGGSSNDTAFRLAYHCIPILKPSLVVFLSTERTRSELYLDTDHIYDLSVWPIGFPMVDRFAKTWISNDVNSTMNYLKNTMAIKQLCGELNIKYVHEETKSIRAIDKARDLQHYGEQTNLDIAAMFLSKI